MKRIILLSIFISTVVSVFCQTDLQDGDSCFEQGDYACAITKYGDAVMSLSGRDKQIAEIKLGRAKLCAEWLKAADQAFNSKNYKQAQENYQNVLGENPKDSYAKAQLGKSSEALAATTLSLSRMDLSFSSSGGREGIAVNTNAASFSITKLPPWCSVDKSASSFSLVCTANTGNTTRYGYFTVTAGDKTIRVDVTQSGIATKTATTLTISRQNISFTASGGRTIIDVKTNASDYQIRLLPRWCTVVAKHDTWFTISCGPNSSPRSRNSGFKVIAGDKEVEITVNQAGIENANTSTSKSNNPTIANTYKTKYCLNCPKTRDIFGLTVGYIQMAYDPLVQMPISSKNYWNGVQLGLRIEPLFKYGFGLNTGIFYEYYSRSTTYTDTYDPYYSYSEKQELQAFNIPLHLEYRLNFSKWFNLFAYGGVGFNAVKNSEFDEYSWPVTFEYGGGMRINRIQFNAGKSSHVGDFKDSQNFGRYTTPYHNLVISMSYMF